MNAFVAGLEEVRTAYGFEAGAVRCVACCVDPSPARAVAASRRWPNLEHYWLDERAIRDLGVARVPARLVLDGNARIRRRWDGAHGRVLQGRHGASLENGSHTLILELADVVHV